ncbi:MAG: type II toxin-antitoxin system RelE/ParE family toxin [Chitinophagales bacterium]|nr:type II toxin-antitoxin system RelE/ParE family toxin [Chitinophagales bacterium]
MSFTCYLLPEAEEEYITSYTWYEEQQEGLGERFASLFRKKLLQVARNPYKYKVAIGDFRETVLGKPFPFVIVYVIDEEQGRVLVVSVFHTSRHPKKKFKQ